MARKATPTRKAVPVRNRSTTLSTPVRNTVVPKAQTSTRRSTVQVTHDQIARRAYEIWLSGTGGTEHENWLRAERELRG